MKLLVVLAGCIALCAGNAIPMVPGDNSHYVEGESRYIWIPDGEGVPHLVDLQEPVDEEFLRNPEKNGANNKYWLYTRKNPTSAQVITNGNANSIWNSNYKSSASTMVIVHGWNNNGNSPMNPQITAACLAVLDANVIVVDWSSLANQGYNTAANGVPSVGQHLGNFIKWLFNTAGGNYNGLHLVGFSLGAHVVGNAGRTISGQAARVTGLDPAGPSWGGNGNALKSSDGKYVEAIHTDGNLLGIMTAIGNANFYPNGGKNPQPGCLISTCSHGRATEFFAATVYFNHLSGKKCNTIWDAELSNCNGSSMSMGNANLNKSGSGMYGLKTGSSWPY